jgi:hypothetical protein
MSMLPFKRNQAIAKNRKSQTAWSNHGSLLGNMPWFFKIWFVFVFVGALSIIGYSMYQVASGNVVGVTTSTECDKSGCVTTQTVKLATPSK